MTPSDVEDIHLIHAHTILVEPPFLDEEESSLGLKVVYPTLLPKIFTRVIKAYQCDRVSVGDYVMFKPHHVLDYYTADHRRIWAMDERAALCIIPIVEWN